MTTLAIDKARTLVLGDVNEIPVVAADIIYEGAAVGDNGAGYARPLVAVDPFLGFAERKADNAAGAAGAVSVRVLDKGKIVVPVTGAAGVGDVGETVYASDDDTFTLVAAGSTAIGKVIRWVSATICEVYFEAKSIASV